MDAAVTLNTNLAKQQFCSSIHVIYAHFLCFHIDIYIIHVCNNTLTMW